MSSRNLRRKATSRHHSDGGRTVGDEYHQGVTRHGKPFSDVLQLNLPVFPIAEVRPCSSQNYLRSVENSLLDIATVAIL